MKRRSPARSKDAAKCDFFLLRFYQKGVIVIIQTYHSRIAGQNFFPKKPSYLRGTQKKTPCFFICRLMGWHVLKPEFCTQVHLHRSMKSGYTRQLSDTCIITAVQGGYNVS